MLKSLIPWMFVLVTLSWDASPTPSVTGYNVYESRVKGPPFVLIKEVGNVLTTTVDPDGPRCYSLKAHDAQGNESVFSNIVCTMPKKQKLSH